MRRIAGIASVSLAVYAAAAGSARFASVATLAQSGSALPTFVVDSSWPKVPSQWRLGDPSSFAVDAQDRIWLLHRPRTLTGEAAAKAAPPVMVFDAAGNYVMGWGGAAPGLEWPEREHGIHVDARGFVWIGGNNCPTNGIANLKPVADDQLLKLTPDGKLVLQIGKSNRSTGNADTSNVHRAADAFVHAPTNEVFVADGYGNHRVIVFDATTGAFKRMWGAFGNKPTDDAPNPADADAGEQGPPQFVQPVHAARVSKDGLVYVSDRGGKRVQVFRLDGTFVRQTFIGRECKAPSCGNGTTAASTAFSTDPMQQFLYVGNRSQAKVMVFERSTLRLLDSFGEWGSAPGQFGTLHHMAADSKGNLYVTEVTPLKPENRRVQKFVLTLSNAR